MKNFFTLILACFIAAIAKLIILTCKIEVLKPSSVKDLEEQNIPVIYAFWHGKMFVMPFIKPKKIELYTIISRHGDGQLIAFVLNILGIKSIRGSTNRLAGEHKKGFPAKNRGGAHVIRESINILEQKKSIAITPDGPKGPAFKFKENSLMIAKISATPIVAINYSASKYWQFKSWDKFILPKPFAKIIVKCSEPYYIDKLDSEDEISAHAGFIEEIINRHC